MAPAAAIITFNRQLPPDAALFPSRRRGRLTDVNDEGNDHPRMV